MSVYGYPEMEREYLGTMAAPFLAISHPQYTLHVMPETGSAALSGPIDHRFGHDIHQELAALFGNEGLTVELKPKNSADGPQHFVAHFTGAAYGRLQTAKQAFDATHPQIN